MPGYGVKKGVYMKNKLQTGDIIEGTVGKMRIIHDFLPSPEELVMKQSKVKVTLALTRRTVEFFKKQAKSQQAQYQKLIRSLLDEYASRHEQASSLNDSSQ